MNSRDYILNKIKTTNKVKNRELPTYENYGIVYEDKFQKFAETISGVGGEALICKREELDATISKLYADEKVIACNVDGCTLGNFEPNEEDDPHNLRDIDLAIVKGNFAVAENGAVWMKNPENRHRNLYYIAQNIVIVVNKEDLVNNMHEAYEQINFEESGFGSFISGPSKTADIEQSLVIGAHGPKSGYVIFVE